MVSADDSELEELIESLREAVLEMSAALCRHSRSIEVPQRSVDVCWFEPKAGSTSMFGVHHDVCWPSPGALRDAAGVWDQKSAASQSLIKTLDECYAKGHAIPGLLNGHRAATSLIDSYLVRAGSARIDETALREVSLALLKEIRSSTVTAWIRCVVEGLQADEPFKIGDSIEFRPITLAEAADFTQSQFFLQRGAGNARTLCVNDWVCDIKRVLPKTDTWNFTQVLLNDVKLAAAAFGLVSSGAVKFVEQLCRLGDGMIEHILITSQYEILSGRNGPRALISDDEVQLLCSTVSALQQLAHAPSRRPLEGAVRRFQMANGRESDEDALVDCIFAIEQLVSLPDERGAAAFQFALRGAVVLSSRFGDEMTRFQKLKKLYDLRSRVAHGSSIDDDIKLDATDARNCLRDILAWYLKPRTPTQSTAELNSLLRVEMIAAGARWASLH